jgi:hypothetical protein
MSFGYQLKDSTIFHHFRSAAKKFTESVQQFQVEHQFPTGGFLPAQYELWVSYADASNPPVLYLKLDTYWIVVEIEIVSDNRFFTVYLVDGHPSKLLKRAMAKFKGSLPLGTFELFSRFPETTVVERNLDPSKGPQTFSGNSEIQQGIPLWRYGPFNEWSVWFKAYQFLPRRVEWKGRLPYISTWEISSVQEYEPWGILDSKIDKITYLQSTSGKRVLVTEWKRVHSHSLDAWKRKQLSLQDPELLNPETSLPESLQNSLNQLKPILASY